MNSSTYLLVVEEANEAKKKGIGVYTRRKKNQNKIPPNTTSIILINDEEEEDEYSDDSENTPIKLKARSESAENQNGVEYDENGNIINISTTTKTDERKQEEERENNFIKSIMNGILSESTEQFEKNDVNIIAKRNKLVQHCYQVIEQSECSFNMPNFSINDLQQIYSGTFSLAKFQTMLMDSLLSQYSTKNDHYDEFNEVKEEDNLKEQIKNTNFPTHRFSTLVVGPSESGKSTYFHTLVREVIDLFIKTKEWKGSICFSFDFVKTKFKEDSIFDLYNYLIEQTFKQISYHLPAFNQFESKIIQHFKQIPNQTKMPTLPKALRNEPDLIHVCTVLEKLTESLYKAIRRSDKMSEFFEIVASIPDTVTSAFGFNRIHFFIDHFDLADITIYPSSTFGTSKSVFLIEVLKKMIAPHSFILGCKNETNFLNLIGSTGPGTADLFSTSTVVNTVSLPFTAKNTSDHLLAEFDGTDQTIRFGAEHCGGSFIYLAQWDSIVSKVLSHNKVTPKEMCVLCDKARALLKKLFDPDTIPKSHIIRLSKVK